MFDITYPPEVEKAFSSYYEKVENVLTWDIVIQKYFSKRFIKRSGNDFIARCCFHGENTASLRFSERKRIFHCFGCGIGGNILTFIIRMEGGIVNAMFFIKKHYHIPLPFKKRQWKAIRESLQLQQVNELLRSASLQSSWHQAFWGNQNLDEINKRLSKITYAETIPILADIDEIERQRKQAAEKQRWQLQKKKLFGQMELLILVRHGHYDSEGRLNSLGERQIRECGKKIEPLLKNRSGIILTSTAPRALDSAHILSEELWLWSSVKNFDLLWSDSMHKYDIAKATKLILQEKDDANVVIVVSHLEYCEYLPSHFSKAFFKKQEECCEVEKGEMIVIDIANENVRKF